MSNESAAAQEASVVQAPSGPETLVVEAILPGCGPERLFAYWTVPALLTTWWPREAEIEPRVGGAYHLRWPSITTAADVIGCRAEGKEDPDALDDILSTEHSRRD